MSSYLYFNNTLIDLDSDIAFPITFSVGDFKNPENRKRSVSKTIEIVGTQNNKRFFASAYNLSLTDLGDSLGFDFNPNVRIKARFIKNGAEVFNGLVRLINVNELKGNYTFEVVLFSDFVNIYKSMEAINVNELDWSEYNHELTHTNISKSWSTSVKLNGIDTPNYSANKPLGFGYWYPIVDFGYNNISLHTISPENFVPYIYVKETIEKIFDNLGFTIDSDFFNTDRFRALTWGFGGGEKEMVPPIDLANRRTTYSFDYASTITLDSYNYGSGNNEIIPFIKYQPSFFSKSIVTDNYLQFDITSGTITVLKSGRYNLNLAFNAVVSYAYTYGSANGQIGITAQVYKNGRLLTILPRYTITNAPTFYNQNSDVSLSLTAGDVVSMDFLVNGNLINTTPFGIDIDFDLNNSFTLDLTSENSLYTEGDTVTLNRFIPDLKCSDFLKGVINMFNLYVSEPNELNEIKIEPLDSFYNGEIENWTKKLDHTKSKSIKPSVNDSHKYYKFNFAEDKDYYNMEYFNLYDNYYGNYIFESENQYNTTEVVFQLPFAQTVPREISKNYILPSIIQIDDAGTVKPYKGKPRIFFNNGLKVAKWSINSQLGLIKYTTYPQAHHVYGDARNGSFDLNFYKPESVNYNFTHYSNANLFTEYNRYFITEQTSIDGKVLTAFFRLNEIENLDFSRLVNINGVLYRKNLITEYNANGEETTSVELYKVLEKKEVNNSSPTIVQGVPARSETGVIRSPSGVGEGVSLLEGGKNTVSKESYKILQI